MARGAELPGVALHVENGQQVLIGVAEPLRVFVGELIDDLQELAQRLRITIRQEGVAKDVAEQLRDAGILRHSGDCLSVEVQRFVAAEARAHQLRPAVAGEFVCEECPLAAQLLALRVHVVHELVHEGRW